MHKRRKTLIAAACITAILVYALHADLFHIYILRDDNRGTILWNNNEAYLFMTIVRRGVRVSYAEYPWAALMEWLGAVRPPTDQRAFLYIIHATPSGLARHLALVRAEPASIPSSFTPVRKTIFTFCNGTLCK